jgi:predicted O-methyltransferase YrrM
MVDLSDTRGFLTGLHRLVRPKTYLEVGVQHGYSLNLAFAAEVAIGIDPQPLVVETANQKIHSMTSDEFFADPRPDGWQIDLAYIDGMHLIEYVVRDFQNIARYCHPRSIVALDDVLPRNQEEARRIPVGTPILGDWTGDVWKIRRMLAEYRPDLRLRLVDTWPTGCLVVSGFPAHPQEWAPDRRLVEIWQDWTTVPPAVLDRVTAITPEQALAELTEEWA